MKPRLILTLLLVAAIGVLVLAVVLDVGLVGFILALLVVALLATAAVGVGIWHGVTSVRRGLSQANQVVPGVPTRAPRAWAGAHTREARLHRRLRQLVSSLQKAAAVSPAVDNVEAEVTQLALRLDDQLVAAAAISGSGRAGAIEKVAKSVEKLEQTVAGLVEAASATDDAAIDDLSRWLDHLDEARSELE